MDDVQKVECCWKVGLELARSEADNGTIVGSINVIT